MAIRKVCTELGLTFGRSKSDLKAILTEEGIKKPTSEQLKEALDHVEEEHHAIFSYTNLTNKIWQVH